MGIRRRSNCRKKRSRRKASPKAYTTSPRLRSGWAITAGQFRSTCALWNCTAATLSTKAHYLLDTILRTSGNRESQQHYRDAVQLLDGMRKEPDADKILQRSFRTMYDEGTRWSQDAKS
jgi:hypothetical protein